MLLPIRPAAVLGLLAVASLACSDSSGPDTDLTVGTFQVAVAPFPLAGSGPCDVAPFELTVEKDGAGQTQVLIPQTTFSCTVAGGPYDLTLTDFGSVGDSLSLVLSNGLLLPIPQLTLHWKPGKTNLSGSAVFDLGGVVADTVPWTGVRQ